MAERRSSYNSWAFESGWVRHGGVEGTVRGAKYEYVEW